MRDETKQHRWLHRFALLTAIMAFPLLFVGGLVTSTGSALAVPDWPTTFGHNMFLYPWSGMVGGIFYEHSHRLLGALVGLLTVVLALAFSLWESRRWLRCLGYIALITVILQGVLGGLRVVLLQSTLAVVHACLAQIFFALLVSLALFTSPGWKRERQQVPAGDWGWRRFLSLVTTGLILVQVWAGAVVRHTGVGLDVHILIGVLVAIQVIWLAVQIRRQQIHRPDLVRPSGVLCGLLLVQLALGVGAYLVKYTALASMVTSTARVGVTTTHLAVGSLMLATSLVLTLRTHHLLMEPGRTRASKLLPEQVSL